MMSEDWLYYVTNPQKLSENYPCLTMAQCLQLMRDFLSFSEASITEASRQSLSNAGECPPTAGDTGAPLSPILNTPPSSPLPPSLSLSNFSNVTNPLNELASTPSVRYQRHYVLDTLALRLWAHTGFDLAFLRAACQPLVLHAHILQALMRSVGGNDAVQLMYGEPRWLFIPSVNGAPIIPPSVLSPEVKFVYILYHRWAVQLSAYTSLLHRCNRPNACPIKKGFTQLPDMLFDANSQRECHNVLKRVPLSVDFLSRILNDEGPSLLTTTTSTDLSSVLYRSLHPQGFQILAMGSKSCIYNSALVDVAAAYRECPAEVVHLLVRLDLGRYFMQTKQFNLGLEHFTEMRSLMDRMSKSGYPTASLPLSMDELRKYLNVCERVHQQIISSVLLSQVPSSTAMGEIPASPTEEMNPEDANSGLGGRARAFSLMESLVHSSDTSVTTWNGLSSELTKVLMGDLCHSLNPMLVKDTTPIASISLDDRRRIESKLEKWADQLEERKSANALTARACSVKVLVCNLLHRVVDGRAVLSPLLYALTSLNSGSQGVPAPPQEPSLTPLALNVISFMLCQVARCFNTLQERDQNPSSRAATFLNTPGTNGGVAERMNLVCFLWFLCQSLQWDWNFAQMMLTSDVSLYLKKEELAEFQQWNTRNPAAVNRTSTMSSIASSNRPNVVEDDLCIVDVDDNLMSWDVVEGVDLTLGEGGQDEWYPGDDSLYPDTWNGTGDTSTTLGPTDTSSGTGSITAPSAFTQGASAMADAMRLLSSYDAEEIAVLVQRLMEQEQWTTVQQLRDMSVCWQVVPQAIAQHLISAAGNKVSRATVHVLVAKALCLRQLQDWQSARQLLQAAEKQAHEMGVYPVKKLIGHELLLVDVEHYLLGTGRKEITEQELRRRSMACLTSVRTESVCLIREEVVLGATCYLLSLKEYDYLVKGASGGSSVLELGRRVAALSKDVGEGKSVGQARDAHHLVTPASMFWEFLSRTFTMDSGGVGGQQSNAPNRSRPGSAPEPQLHLTASQLLSMVRLLSQGEHFDLLLTALAQLLNTCRADVSLHCSEGPFCSTWASATAKVHESNAAQVTEVFRVTLDTALSTLGHQTQSSTQPSSADIQRLSNWWLLRADLCYAEMQFAHALRAYLQAVMVGRDVFTLPICDSVLSSRVVERMVRCLETLGYIGQAVVMAQWMDQGTKMAAQLLKSAVLAFDCIDSYVDFLWDINLIEILTAYEFKNGVPYRAKEFAATIGRAELNINNHDLVLQEAVKRRKIEFLKVLVDTHLCA